MDTKDRFLEIRKELGLSQAKFDNKLELPTGTSNSIDSGRGRVTPEIAKKIEEVFKINLRWLLFGEGEKYISEEKSECKISECKISDSDMDLLRTIIIKIEESDQKHTREWTKENKADSICKAFELLLDIKAKYKTDDTEMLINRFFDLLDKL